MRTIIWLSVSSSLSAFLLAVFCFIQIPVVKQPTQIALASIDKVYIKRFEFSAKEIKELDGTLGTIRWNDYVFRATHANLWPAGVFGFLFLAVLNFGIAILASRFTSKQA
ncbi:MAG: hypothetical protein ABL880_00540 [Methylotenera sp.]